MFPKSIPIAFGTRPSSCASSRLKSITPIGFCLRQRAYGTIPRYGAAMLRRRRIIRRLTLALGLWKSLAESRPGISFPGFPDDDYVANFCFGDFPDEITLHA